MEGGAVKIGVSCHEEKTCTRSKIVRYFYELPPVHAPLTYVFYNLSSAIPRNIYPLYKRFSKLTFIKWMKQRWILRQRESKSQLGWFKDFKIFSKEYC